MTAKRSGGRGCLHTIKSEAWLKFMQGTNEEPIIYCWDCGSLKRGRKSWQYTSREEKIRDSLAATRARRTKKKGRGAK